MTVVGAGGIRFDKLSYTKKFQKEYRKLDGVIQDKVNGKLIDLAKASRPSGLRFEKLASYKNPDIYTIHVDGNYKISIHLLQEIEASTTKCIGVLRRVATHNEIDRKP